MDTGTPTNLIVFGRGLDLSSNSEPTRLSPASCARVDTALTHIEGAADLFAARSTGPSRGRVVFSGGFARAAAGLEATPPELREGRLMLERAHRRGVNGAGLDTYVDAFAENESESTLENAIYVRENGYFADVTFTPENPLGLVAHREHMARCDFFTRKVLRLDRTAVRHIFAPGEDNLSRDVPETSLYRLTRLACLGASTPAGLRRRERLMLTAANLLTR